MKKVILSLALVVALSTGCTKNYTCTCICTPSGGAAFTESGTIPNTTLSDAQTKCTADGQAAVGGNGTWNCTVK